MKRHLTFLLFLLCATMQAQDMANNLIENAIKQGVILFREDYQLLNEDDEPIANKAGQDCYGRSYTCGVRTGESSFLVIKDCVAPWTNQSIVKSEKRHPEISYSGFLTLSTIDFEQFDLDPESAEEVIPNHIYRVEGSEVEGFDVDPESGRKKGYAVWLKAENSFCLTSVPSGLSLDIAPFNINTRAGSYVYDVEKQPEGNVVGGVFITPRVDKVGKISLYVNGLFEKRGGVWKFISLGTEEPNE